MVSKLPLHHLLIQWCCIALRIGEDKCLTWATVSWGYECTDCLLNFINSCCQDLHLRSVMEFLCNLTDTAVAHRLNWLTITFGFQANLPTVLWWNLHCYCCSECSLVLAVGRCACMLNIFLTITQVLALGFQIQTHGAPMLWWKASAAVLFFSLIVSVHKFNCTIHLQVWYAPLIGFSVG